MKSARSPEVRHTKRKCLSFPVGLTLNAVVSAFHVYAHKSVPERRKINL